MRFQVTSHVGVFWKGPDIILGIYRWLWLAKLRAWVHVRIENPYRAVTVEEVNNDQSVR